MANRLRNYGCRSALTLSMLLLSAPLLAEESGSPNQADPAAEDSPTTQASKPEKAQGEGPFGPPPARRLNLQSINVVRMGPAAAESQNALAYSHRLYKSSNPLLMLNVLQPELNVKLNPAGFKIGPALLVSPLSILSVRMGADFVQHAGTFGILQSYDDATADYSDTPRIARGETQAYAASGVRLFLEPSIQLKAGPLAFRLKWGIEHHDMALADSDGSGQVDRVFYDPPNDTLLPAQGLVWGTEASLLYLHPRAVVGVQYTAVNPVYTQYEAGEGDPEALSIQNAHKRIGPLVAIPLPPPRGNQIQRPTLAVVTGYYLQHPYRHDPPAAYVLVAFAFNVELMRRGD